jgi:hypothetical protein
MTINRTTLVRTTLVACALGAVAVTGCSKKSDTDVGAANLTVHQALAITDISSMTVAVTGSGITHPLSVPLVQKGNQFSALISNLPVGTDYVFTASAKDAAAVELYHGAVTAQTIQKNKTANIVINMNQVAAGVAFSNKAPVVDAISSSASAVSYGDLVTIQASAKDPDAGQTALLTFGWTTTCGTLGAPTNVAGTDTTDGTSTVIFTAPSSDNTCTVNLTVTDPKGLKNVASISIQVGAGNARGGAKVTVNPNTYPVISGMDATPVPLVKGAPTTLTVSASDPDGDALTFAWTSPCTGVFGAAAAASTTFTLDAASTATSCDFSVVVTDGHFADGSAKGVITNSLTLPVASPAGIVLAAPVMGLGYQSQDTISGGDLVKLAIVATDPAAGVLTYVWTASSGPAPVVSTPAAIGLDPTLFTSAVTWTAPAGAQDGSSVTITVTATSSVTHQSQSSKLTLNPLNGVCNGQPDGTDCTATAHASNQCVTAATCASGSCVANTSVTCPASTVACQTNACVPSTGLCALSAATNNTPCDDGNACTGVGGTDVCSAGVCTGTAKVCAAPANTCQVATCNTTTGACGSAAAVDGTLCSDNNQCTTTDKCTAGVCVGSGALVCGAGLVCDPALGCTTPAACMSSLYAQKVVPPLLGLANSTDGSVWAVGELFSAAPGYDFGNGVPLITTGSSDIYLAKINPATGLATAAFRFGDGASNDQFATAVASASNGGAALLGTFTGELDITNNYSDGSGPGDNGAGVAGLDFVTSSSAVDVYSVFASDGTPIKTHMANMGTGGLAAIGSNPAQNAYAICGKASALVPAYAASGTGKGILLIPSGAGYTNTAGGGFDIVVAKIDATSGAVLWGRQIGGAGDQACSSVTLDNNGDVILTGTYNNTLNFGGATTALPVVSDTTAAVLYVAKLSGSNGAGILASAWGTTGRQQPKSITVDASSNIILAGALGANIDFGGGHTITNLGLTDAFVVKFNGSLVAQWAFSYGDAVFNQQAASVATSSNGDVYVSGLFSGSLGSLGVSSNGTTTADAFVAHLAAADGSASCANVYGDSSGAQSADYLTVARSATGALLDSVVIGGGYSNAITFGATSLTTSGPGVGASYIARLHP